MVSRVSFPGSARECTCLRCGAQPRNEGIKIEDQSLDWAAQLTVNPDSLTAFELYNRCFYFYCSAGADPENNPLPAFVENMATDPGTRHVCERGTYWDPDAVDPFTGVRGGCVDFTACYDPENIGTTPCKSDFDTEFGNWLDNFGPNEPDMITGYVDCIIDGYDLDGNLLDNGVALGDTEGVLCCPIWQHGENTYPKFNTEQEKVFNILISKLVTYCYY